ncbi:MAG: hypothetical protein WKG07_44640 [Hymenobacter sp.]
MMGATLFVAALFVLVNIGVDMLYAVARPASEGGVGSRTVLASAARQSHPNDTRAARSPTVRVRLPRCARNDER